MNVTPIEWTTFSANPLKYRDPTGKVVWGCVHASPGCMHCYSEALAKRYGRGGPFTVPVMNTLTPFLDEDELHKMRTAKTIGGIPVAGSRCFLGDMTDIFGEWVSDDLLNRLFSDTLEIRTDVTWQILTKRADRLHRYLSWRWGEGRIPSQHIHIGVSVEDQQRVDERIPLLLKTPAAVRFISAEPLLGAINFSEPPLLPSYLPDQRLDPLTGDAFAADDGVWLGRQDRPRLDWVIVGGESGPGARPCDRRWIYDILSQCQSARVPCFVKQLGSKSHIDQVGAFLPLKGKGGHLEDFPPDLRVREYPA